MMMQVQAIKQGMKDDYLFSRDIIDFGDGLHGNV
jgi:hypothetical protein